MNTDLARFFHDGGVLMPVILLAFVCGSALCVVQIVLARRVDLMPALVGALVMVLGLGSLGFLFGLSQGLRAFATAPPDMASMLFSASLSKALNVAALASILSVPLVIASMVVVTVRHNLARSMRAVGGQP